MSWDQTRFDAILKDYMLVTSKTCAQALNTKAYFIARGALYHTAKADRAGIASRLNRTVTVATEGGALKHAPLAALILNKRAGKGAGLYGPSMREAIRKLISVRQRSVAYLKSGWIPAIRHLQGLAFKSDSPPPNDSAARQIGTSKGGSTAALPAFASMQARIWNSAQARHTSRKDALDRIGSVGLQRAFNDEANSMEQYFENKLRADAHDANVRLAA